MVVFLATVALLLCPILTAGSYRRHDLRFNKTPKLNAGPASQLPPPDGALHLYTLPVGYGDAHVVQCPKGELTIFDMGSTDRYFGKFWEPARVQNWLGAVGRKSVRTMFLSTHDEDYVNYLPQVFNETMDLLDFQNLYISCDEKAILNDTQTWLANVVKTQLGHNKTMVITNTFHDALPCLAPQCETANLTICPGEPSIHVEVVAANMGSCRTLPGRRGADSLLLRLHHSSVSILMGGGLSNEGTPKADDLPLDRIMMHMTPGLLKSNIYKMGHHGTNEANPYCWLSQIQPEAIFVSSNPFQASIMQPHCNAIWKTGQWLSKATSPYYLCWQNLGQNGVLEDHAIYTTTDGDEPHTVFLINLTTDGKAWNFNTYNATQA